MRLTLTNYLKRRMLGGGLPQNIERDGKYFMAYDGMKVEHVGGGALIVSLTLKGESLFSFEPTVLEIGGSLNVTGLEGLQEISLS
jgi:hypothetical protein